MGILRSCREFRRQLVTACIYVFMMFLLMMGVVMGLSLRAVMSLYIKAVTNSTTDFIIKRRQTANGTGKNRAQVGCLTTPPRLMYPVPSNN